MTTRKTQIDCRNASISYRGTFMIEETKADFVALDNNISSTKVQQFYTKDVLFP